MKNFCYRLDSIVEHNISDKKIRDHLQTAAKMVFYSMKRTTTMLVTVAVVVSIIISVSADNGREREHSSHGGIRGSSTTDDAIKWNTNTLSGTSSMHRSKQQRRRRLMDQMDMSTKKKDKEVVNKYVRIHNK